MSFTISGGFINGKKYMGVTISGGFINHVRFLYDLGLQEALSEKGVRYGINAHTSYGLPAYILAAASVEAFFNEVFMQPISWMLNRLPPLNVSEEWLEKVAIGPKILIVPQLLVGRSLMRNEQPYQDLALLIKVRNDLIHYKMSSTPPKYLADLTQRRIILAYLGGKEGKPDFLWPHKLECTEGIRWAHNTACAVVEALVGLLDANQRGLGMSTDANFSSIPESVARDWFTSHNIDPNSNYPQVSTEA